MACVVVAVAAALTLTGGAPAAPSAPDCDGPPAAATPGSPAWHAREADNVFCGTQRSRDTQSNPAYAAAASRVQAEHGGPVPEDPFRDPDRLAGHRFRFQRISFVNRSGDARSGFLFRPCDRSCRGLPAGLRPHGPPYPAVVIVHGGAASQEMYLWGAEALAEAGYMVLTFQIPEPENAAGDSHYADAKAALDYLLASPRARARGGRFNPRWTELDREHVGLAGHSAGGVAVSRLGQEDRRVSAVVSWDRAKSTPMPPHLRMRTPALFLVADFNCQQVPVCLPEAYDSPPDPRGPGNKDEDFRRVRAAGVETMKVALRAVTHLDFTEFAPTPPSSRYGAIVSSYYTLAWFDRYLRYGRRALGRLTATRFDRSADQHYISGGTYDAAKQRNVPAHIAGRRVADRLSFHFRSAWYLARGRVRCESVRAGCAATPAAVRRRPFRRPCAGPRLLPGKVAVRRGRVSLRPTVRCQRRVRSIVVALRAGPRTVHLVTGQRATLRVPRRLHRIGATFAVDGRRHRASIRLRRG